MSNRGAMRLALNDLNYYKNELNEISRKGQEQKKSLDTLCSKNYLYGSNKIQ